MADGQEANETKAYTALRRTEDRYFCLGSISVQIDFSLKKAFMSPY